MAGGQTHAVDTQYVAAVGGVAAAYTNTPVEGLAFAGGALLGLFVNPDLDQQAISRIEWRLIKHTFGLGFLWLAYWWPYAVALSHRSISHWPLLGTLTRLIYLAPVWYVLWLVGVRPGPWLVWAIAGLVVSDLAHWLRDAI
jgi:uncharacterized metal-binding protein